MMTNEDYKMWIEDQRDISNKHHTFTEIAKLRALDLALDYLVPTDKFLEFVGGLDKLLAIDIFDFYNIVYNAFTYFKVTPEMIIVRIKLIFEENNREIGFPLVREKPE